MGQPLFIDEDEDNPTSSRRVCIKTNCWDKITGKVLVDIEDEKFIISVNK